MKTRIGIIATLVIALCAGACANRQTLGEPGPVYPADVERGPTLNIQVVQLEKAIRFTNTTDRSFENARVWLNSWFSAPVGRIDVGQTVTAPLKSFADRNGGRPRSGGFFATRQEEPIVQVQIEDGGAFYGLILVDPDAR